MTSETFSVDDGCVIAENVIKRASQLGAYAAETGISSGNGMTVTVRNGELETLEHHRDKSMVVSVYVKANNSDSKKACLGKGSATTTDFDPQSIERTVSAAYQIAAQAEPDEFAGLLDKNYLATDIPNLELDHEWDIEAKQAINIACEADATARQQDQRISQIDDTSVNTYRGMSVYANSHGFNAGYQGSRYGLSCVVVGSQDEAMQRGYWYTSARDPQDLENAAEVGRRAGERTAAKLGARKLETTSAPVIFEAPVAGGLFGHFISGISGGSLYRKASFLVDSINTEVFPKYVTMSEAPHLPKGMASAPYDSDGGRTKPRDLVSEGVVTGYVLSAYSARRLGMEPTGNAGGIHNLLVNHSEQSLPQLMATMKRGLLVTELMGFGINMVTGDYSRGASGFWIEDGEIAYPVEEITIAGNLREMFMNIVAIGNDVDRRGSIQSGSVMIESMTIAGA